jgi:ABC-type polysaccharide/polyol phosphate export permease
MLALGIGWLLAALTVFVKDVAQVVAIVLQFGFWLTPIFWEIGMVPEQYRFLFRFNPAWYIVEGYRKSFLYRTPLWEENLPETLWFWGVTLCFLLVGITVFRRLRVHFADVL